MCLGGRQGSYNKRSDIDKVSNQAILLISSQVVQKLVDSPNREACELELLDAINPT